ncbi:MAG: MMPL family transporter [Planctomycetales bacterium]|nr:MMPL family transporter [Planctomycetales bacterium]
MHPGMYKLVVSRFVSRRWFVVIGMWILFAAGLRWCAPDWADIVADGDLAFLPETVPSVVGQQALEHAFPGSQARSQMVIVFANESQLAGEDIAFALDVTRQLHWFTAKTAWLDLKRRGSFKTAEAQASVLTSTSLPTGDAALPPSIDAGVQNAAVARNESTEARALQESVMVDLVRDNLTQAIEIDEELSRYMGTAVPGFTFRWLPDAYQMRGELLTWLKLEPEQARLDLDTHALLLEQRTATLDAKVPEWAEYLRDVWSWRNAVVGHKLGSDEARARLVSLQLGTDVTATRNISIIAGIENLVANMRAAYPVQTSEGLDIQISGSAAVGADMLRASAHGVRTTEIVTILLVFLILAAVYRAPFLVAIPITSIAVSLFVATSVIAILARDPADPSGFGLGVFTTTRIFIVVILFGAGTDFCLFLLARNREMLTNRRTHSRRQMQQIVASSWRHVHDALVASALTTIVGLGLMWFSQFEKFRFSGPIIAISLAITLTVCLTFTPALLSGLGQLAFWPLLPVGKRNLHQRTDNAQLNTDNGSQDQLTQQIQNCPTNDVPPQGTSYYWFHFATLVVQRPMLTMSLAMVVLLPPSLYGLYRLGSVTYDLTEELSETAPSRRGARLLSQFFPTQDGSPITILLTRDQPFETDEELRDASSQLAELMYVDGVESVRSLVDPLGDYPPGKRMGLFAKDAWRRRILLGHHITRDRYVSSVAGLGRRVARFDVVVSDNPFSIDASETLSSIRRQVQDQTKKPDSPWYQSEVTAAGTTVGITDLRNVTQSDQSRIQVMVTIGVWLVLVVLLRQLVLSTYLIFTVLLSYFATLGVSYFVFSMLYGDTYTGLDWKVPIFLFVILVAVGQDYNVYLVTRIIEEQRHGDLRAGVQRALHLTGGIITSCGMVMAGTFIAMTSPAVLLWLGGRLPAGWIDVDAPVLRGITELGFALAFGVLLDTFAVRSILVPSFVVVWQNRQVNKSLPVAAS